MATTPYNQGMEPAAINQDASLAIASPQSYRDAPMDAATPSNGQFMPGGMQAAPEEAPPEDFQEPEQPAIRAMLEEINIAEKLEKKDKDLLHKIGQDALKGFEDDLESRRDWEVDVEEWTKLAIQTKEEKTYPWPRASNIKYPLLSTAAMQFAARAYPSLVPSDGQVVKAKVIGKDPDGEKQKRAERTSIYASWQLMNEMPDWEEEMDKLLIMLPVVGTMFKKTYWDSVTKKNCSKLVLPKNLVVNYWTKTLESCERISEIIEMSPRILHERVTAGVFLDCDLGDAPQPQTLITENGPKPDRDQTTPYTLIEQHTFIDLDDDGYEEPYIVTFHRETGKVLRITARFDERGITLNDKNEVVRIEPIQYYTKFGFIPNPNGCFYDIGFGVLLGPINDSVNTLINQLVDAGSLSNLQSGFIGKGLRIKMGETRFQPGEWKAVNATGDDLKKQIYPLPVKEPSNVLFELMGALITSGKELASVAEIFTGKSPGQNTPATTTMATIEQGMKVFTAVYKRTYRSLTKEYEKLYRLNEVYLNPQTYVEVMDTTVSPDDFKAEGYDICPGADPTAISQTERLLKAQGLVEMLPMGVLDPLKVVIRVLEAQEQPNWQELIHQETQESGQPAQQPDPKVLEMQMRSQADQQSFQLKQQEAAFKQEMEGRSQQFKQAMETERLKQEAYFKDRELALRKAESLHKLNVGMAQKKMDQNLALTQKQQAHVQKLTHAEQQHRQKQEQLKSQPKANSKSGKPAK